MHYLLAVILGLIQGLTEFIPVSSSGHLLFVEKLVGWDTSKLAFDVALHWGTLVALLCFFWNDWIAILTSFGRRVFKGVLYDKQPEDARTGRLFIPIVIATIPAGIVGYKLDKHIEALRDKHWILPAVAGVLALIAVVMLLAERVGQKKRAMGSMNYADYIIIGCAQALALFPGVSRSGATITAGLFRGLDRAAAARFSFLLSTPAILGAGLLMLKNLHKTGLPHGDVAVFAVGFATAAISGYFAIKFLMGYLQRGSLRVFAIYRFLLAAAMLIAFLR